MANSQENSSDKIYEIEQYCDSENDFADTEYESDYLSDDGNYINIRFADERDIISLNTRKRDQPIESTDDEDDVPLANLQNHDPHQEAEQEQSPPPSPPPAT